jgi:hypothetical protein
LKALVSPSQNKVRKYPLSTQIEFHHLNVHERTLQCSLYRSTRHAQRYKQRYVRKKLTLSQRQKRLNYRKEHVGKSVHDFWQYVIFTDEAHFDPGSAQQGRILREAGTALEPENIQERGEKKGNTLHFAAWCTYNDKAESLIFYNNESEQDINPAPPRKPRRSKYITDEQYNQEILAWEAEKGRTQHVKPKGNAMTQKYYCDKHLPIYIDVIAQKRLQEPEPWQLVEDGDPSHGTRGMSLAQQMREGNWIVNLPHPPNSPDLNPQEAVWNILKQRVRLHTWNSMEELKRILQAEYRETTQEQIRKRIDEMPGRCQRLVNTNGGPIKSQIW